MRTASGLEVPPLVSVHVPKTAGTSFTSVLHQLFGNRLWLDHGVPADPPPWALCIHGHAWARPRLEQFPDALLATWVRDPVERLLSQHRYWATRPDMANPICRRLHEERLGPVELAELLPDLQSSIVGGDLARYDFVGVVEQTELSLRVFSGLVGNAGLTMPHVNASGRSDVDEATRDRIAEVCAPDMDLYRQGLVRLKELALTDPARTRLRAWASALPGTPARGYGRTS